MSKEDRFIILDDFTFIKHCEHGKSKPSYLEKNGQKVVFKTEAISDIYREYFYSLLLSCLTAKKRNLSLAMYHGEYGLVSKNYNSTNLLVKNMNTMIDNYKKNQKNSDLTGKLYNLEDLKTILMHEYPTCASALLNTINKKLFFHFVLEILFANGDLNPMNIEIIGEKIPRLIEPYDFDGCGMINLSSEEHKYFLKYKRPRLLSESAQETLKTFLKSASPLEIQTFQFYFEKAQAIKMETISNDIPVETKKKLVSEFNQNLIRVRNLWEKVS